MKRIFLILLFPISLFAQGWGQSGGGGDINTLLAGATITVPVTFSGTSLTLARATADTVSFMNSDGSFIRVEDNNVAKFFVSSVGDVGIGTTTPEGTLHIETINVGIDPGGTPNLIIKGSPAIMYMLSPNGIDATMYFGQQFTATFAIIQANAINGTFTIGTEHPGAEMRFVSGNVVETARYDALGVYYRPAASLTLAASVTTFALNGGFITVTGDAGANTIATITGATNFTEVTLLFVDALVTVTDDNAHGADSIDLSAAFTSADDSVLRLAYDGTSWYEVSRSVN